MLGPSGSLLNPEQRSPIIVASCPQPTPSLWATLHSPLQSLHSSFMFYSEFSGQGWEGDAAICIMFFSNDL